MILTLTPFGEPCVITRNHIASKIIFSQVRGGWQMSVARSLIENGFVVGYKANGCTLRGKARNYGSKYEKSLMNLMRRVQEGLEKANIDIYLCAGEVGPKGAYGYYLR